MDINDTASQWLARLGRTFKHSDFHTIEVSVGHLHVGRGPRTFLAKRNDDKIECDQMMAQSQVVDQVTLQEEEESRGGTGVNLASMRAPALLTHTSNCH